MRGGKLRSLIRQKLPTIWTLRKGAVTSTGRIFMMDLTQMSTVMTWGMGLICLIVIAFLVLGIAAFIKYLRS